MRVGRPRVWEGLGKSSQDGSGGVNIMKEGKEGRREGGRVM